MKHSLAHNAGYNLIYQLLNVLFPLVSAGYVARILAPEGIGTVTNAQNIVSYFVMFAALGIPSYGTREISKCRNDEAGRNAVFSELLLINALATTCSLAAYIWLSPYLIPGDCNLRVAVGLELIFCYAGIDWLYRGMEEYGYITTRNILVKTVSLVSLFLFVQVREDYVTYAVIHSLGIGCNSLYNLIHAKNHVNLKISGLNLKRHFVPILWLLMGSITASLYSKVDISMLGNLADSASVAYYANSHKIVGLCLGLVTALTSVFLPRLSFLYALDRDSFNKCLTDGLHILLLVTVPACVGICLVAKNLMVCVFGDLFLPGAAVLQILAILAIIKGIGDLLCYQTIVCSGNERYLIWSRLAAGIVNVILNAVLIPRYTYCGAAIASVISELIVNGMLLPRVLKVTKLSVSAKFCGSVVISTTVMAIGVLLLQNAMGTGAASLVLSVVTGIFIYGLMQIITNSSAIRKLWFSIRAN